MSELARQLTTHKEWDWNKARGALATVDGIEFLGSCIVQESSGPPGVTYAVLHKEAEDWDGCCDSHVGDSVLLDLSAPSTHGVLLGILHGIGMAPPSMRKAEESAESYGQRLAARILSDWLR